MTGMNPGTHVSICVAQAHEPAADVTPAGGSAARVLRFYERLGLEPTGQKMRRIIAPIPPLRRPPTESEST